VPWHFLQHGDTLIGTGTKSRGMGGAGIGVSHCAESTLSNPALITCTKGTSISFGGTIFMPDISAQIGTNPAYDSASDMNVIPSVAISHKIDDNWYVGIGMWGTAGMGVDYRDATPTSRTDTGNLKMLTNLQLMQFAPSVAYSTGKAGVALTTIVQYGALDINYKMPTRTGIVNVGDGVSQDFGYGFNLGAYYDLENGITLGAVYKSKIKMKYDHQLSTATQPFVGNGFSAPLDDYLDQPSELGVGLGYKLGRHTFAFDYRKIKWSDARGYKDFGWDDQNVYALGYQFKNGKWKYRAGYNYAKSPLKEQAPTQAGLAINLFNLMGFPATAEKHYTIGTGYEFSDNFYVDLAYVYAPKTTTTMNTPDMMGGMTTSTVKHSESSLSVQFSYRFF